MLEPIETLVNAQAAVSTKLAAHWLSFVRAGAVPALALVGVFVWMVEAYCASAAFKAGEVAVLACASVAALFLSSLGIGRMVRIALKIQPRPSRLRALGLEAGDAQTLGIGVGCVALVALAFALQSAAHFIVVSSFFAPGSDAIARPVLALADAGILIGLYYLLGRLALFLPACAAAPQSGPAMIWRAGEGHGAILFIVAGAVPWALASLLAGPVLLWVGALPWPGLDDLARSDSLGSGLIARLYAVVPLVFLAILVVWAFTAAGLAAAWEALDERGAFDAEAAAT